MRRIPSEVQLMMAESGKIFRRSKNHASVTSAGQIETAPADPGSFIQTGLVLESPGAPYSPIVTAPTGVTYVITGIDYVYTAQTEVVSGSDCSAAPTWRRVRY